MLLYYVGSDARSHGNISKLTANTTGVLLGVHNSCRSSQDCMHNVASDSRASDMIGCSPGDSICTLRAVILPKMPKVRRSAA
jgi:hypothetical protein